MNVRLLFLSLSLALVGIGCGPKADQEPGAGIKAKGDFKVALLTPGPVSDSGWNAMANDGLMAIQKELGAEISQRESSGTNMMNDMRAYAQEGYNLVIGHGFEYNETAVKAAPDFPNTVFVTSSGGKFGNNAGAFRFYMEQGFYVAGFVAGSMSKSGTVAMIGGPDVPSIRSTFKGFRAGALAARPGIKVIETFTGKESDVAAAKLATLTAIKQGADFVIHQANAAAQGVFDACHESNILAFGSNLDQNDNAAGCVLGSAVIRAKPAFLKLAQEVKEKKYHGRIDLMGMDSGAIEFVWSPVLLEKVPVDLRSKVDQLITDLKAGKVVAPKDEF